MNIRDPLIIMEAEDLEDPSYLHNGLRCLYPETAEHTIELRQAGSIHVVCKLDAEGAWKEIQMHRVVRAPVEFHGEKKPQYFRIYRIKKMRSGGDPTIEFDARHIIYDLNYILLDDVRPTNKSCEDAIQWIFDHVYAPDGTSQMPIGNYSFSSDIETVSSANYQWVSLIGALIGEDNCILNRWGGEFYVDNYYFSINEKRENSMEDSFCIAYGLNLTDITEEIEATDVYSRVVANDNQGHSRTATVSISSVGLPFERTIHAAFSYDDETDDSRFQSDFEEYADSLNNVEASYSVKYNDIPLDDPFRALETCEVGDTGTITDSELGITTAQKVIKTVTDLLTGRRLSTETGTWKRSIARKQKWSDTVTVNQTAEQKQIAKLNSDLNDLDFSVTIHTPIASSSGKFLTTSGGKFLTYKED